MFGARWREITHTGKEAAINPRMTVFGIVFVCLLGLALLLVHQPGFDLAELEAGAPSTGETTILAGR